MIKRFEAVCSCSEPDMRESEFGGYVSFDDHIATIAAKDAEIAKLREAAAFAKAALEALKGYEADYGEPLPDDHELGRIEDSRSSPSFRIRVGHIRRLAGEA